MNFADSHKKGLYTRVSQKWDLSHRLPIPKFSTCPVCQGTLIMKDWKFHKRPNSGKPWRCDVRLKCIDCSYVPMFGVAVPKPMYENSRQFIRENVWVSWRLGKQILSEDGYTV